MEFPQFEIKPLTAHQLTKKVKVKIKIVAGPRFELGLSGL